MTRNADNDNATRPAWYDELVQKYERLIKRIAKQYGRSYDSEEFEQDIYVDLYRRWALYNSDYSFGTWICLCARNVSSMHKQRKMSLKRTGTRVELSAAEAVSYPSNQEASTDLAVVRSVLSGGRRTDILMRIASGELLREIAAEYGIGKERVRQIGEQERKAIRQRLGFRPGEVA